MNLSEDDRARDRRENWWRTVFIILATLYVALLLIGLVLQILGGFAQIALIVFTAWLLAFVLSPVVAWVQARLGDRRGLSIGLVYAATLIGSGFLLFYAASSIAGSMGDLARNFSDTRDRIEDTLRTWQAAISFGRFEAPDLVGLYADLEDTVVRVGLSALGEVPQVTASVLGSLVLVVILSLYMLADSERILAKLNRLVPTRYADEAAILERTVSRAFGGFLRAQVILAGIQTGLTAAVVLLVGLPYGFIIGGTSALAMLIPFFGPPLALVPPIVATAAFAPQWLIPVAVILLVVQTVLVNYLQPRLMHEALGMHPILVLLGLLVGAQVAGLWGALFGIPVLAVLNVFVNYAINLRTLDETPEPTEDMIEEVRREAPDASPEVLVALAAERAAEDDVADGEVGEASEALREAADRLDEERSGGA